MNVKILSLQKISLLVLLLVALTSFSQTVNYRIDTGGVRQVCIASFVDDGGTSNNYRTLTNEVITFQPETPLLQKLIFSFTSFDVHISDTLYVFDGQDTLAPLIMKLNNSTRNLPFVITSGLGNVSGSLTFLFRSDSSDTGTGWVADSRCIIRCQEIQAVMNATACSPGIHNESGYQYFNLCLSDTLVLSAVDSGITVFPGNNIRYHQDGLTSMFIWYFGDGYIDTGSVVKHKYDTAFGYNLYLKVIDTLGCLSNNNIKARVRIPRLPYLHVSDGLALCSENDSLFIHVGANPGNDVIIDTSDIHIPGANAYDSTVIIPDGPNCPGYANGCLRVELNVNSFMTNINSAQDIVSVCVGAEHSFSGDLSFRLICPNGHWIMLDSYSHSGGNWLGNPYGGTNHEVYDNGCDPVNNPSGTPGTYCWSESYNTPHFRTLDYLGSNGSSPISETDLVNNTGYIWPGNSFSGLAGCPVNGTWALEICDDFGIDNGYLFWWQINFNDPGSIPNSPPWNFNAGIDSIFLLGENVSRVDSSDFYIKPVTTGSINYIARVKDDYGCYFDQSVSIYNIPMPSFDLGEDRTTCVPVTLSGPLTANEYLWSTGSQYSSTTVQMSNTYWLRAGNTVFGKTCYGYDTINLTFLPLPVIKGIAKFETDTIERGFIQLYDSSFNRVYTQLFDNSYFNLTGMDTGRFFVTATPDYNLYPRYLTCFYPGSLYWENAIPVSVQCNTVNEIQIELQEMIPSPSGNGQFSGNVFYVSDTGIAAAASIEMVNKDYINNRIYSITYTDYYGYYFFSNLAYGRYSIIPEIPGYSFVDPYEIFYNSRINVFSHLDYYIYGNVIYTYNPLGIDEYHGNDLSCFSVSPNPAENELNIYTAAIDDKDAELLVYDMDGRLLHTQSVTGSKTVLDISLLEDGMYLIMLKTKGLYRAGKFVKY